MKKKNVRGGETGSKEWKNTVSVTLNIFPIIHIMKVIYE